jgi:hypothetical protein
VMSPTSRCTPARRRARPPRPCRTRRSTRSRCWCRRTESAGHRTGPARLVVRAPPPGAPDRRTRAAGELAG